MTKTILQIFFLFASIVSFGQTAVSELNLDFEQSYPDSPLPYRWFQWGSGYKLNADTTTRYGGKTSMLISPIGEKGPNSFGCVAMAIPSFYDAKEIEVQAYMKLNNVADGPIGLMVRIDGSSGILGFENMQSKNIQGTNNWALYSVKIPFPENAKTIYIGALLSGTGQLWVDDFKILLDGKDISEAKIIKPKEYKADSDKEFDKSSGISNIALTGATVGDLAILGKIWGYLKYYHPSVANGDYNWDYELFRILPKIANAKNRNERNLTLSSWIGRLGDYEEDEKPINDSAEVKLTPDLSWIEKKELGPELTRLLTKLQSAKQPGEHYYIGKIPGVGNPEFKNEKPYSFSYPDQGFRLLSLFRYWNMIAYYFPYKNLIEEDWNKVLSEFIPKFINANNELEYKLATLAIIARIHDTHGNIWGSDNALNQFKGNKYSALEITFVEERAIVTDYLNQVLGEKTGLKIGDAIETIDNRTVNEIVKEKLPLTPASNYPTQLRDIARDLLRTNKESLDITYWNGKEEVSTQIQTYNSTEIDLYTKYHKKDTCFKMINSDIAYLYPGSIKNEYLPAIMDEVAKTKGLIIDFRCYPSDFIVFSLTEYLLPEEKSFVKFSNGSIESPGLFTMTKELKVGRSNPGYYKGKTVIIVNETTQSSAEYHTMAFRTAPGAIVIGSTTAGADGNVSQIILPGGINTMISGIGIYYPDGSETQRIGILPDMTAKPTVKGIRDGKDELLDMAIKIINTN
jgi:C-terminal processing protease CtpA/Prc